MSSKIFSSVFIKRGVLSYIRLSLGLNFNSLRLDNWFFLLLLGRFRLLLIRGIRILFLIKSCWFNGSFRRQGRLVIKVRIAALLMPQTSALCQLFDRLKIESFKLIAPFPWFRYSFVGNGITLLLIACFTLS